MPKTKKNPLEKEGLTDQPLRITHADAEFDEFEVGYFDPPGQRAMSCVVAKCSSKAAANEIIRLWNAEHHPKT